MAKPCNNGFFLSSPKEDHPPIRNLCMASPNSSSLHLFQFAVICLLDGWLNCTPDKVLTIPCTMGINLMPENVLINSQAPLTEVRVLALCVRKIWGSVRWHYLPEWERWQEGNGTAQRTLLRPSSSCPLGPKAHPCAVCTEPRQSSSLLRQSDGESKTSHASKEKLLQHRIWEDWECF